MLPYRYMLCYFIVYWCWNHTISNIVLYNCVEHLTCFVKIEKNQMTGMLSRRERWEFVGTKLTIKRIANRANWYWHLGTISTINFDMTFVLLYHSYYTGCIWWKPLVTTRYFVEIYKHTLGTYFLIVLLL